MTARGMMANTVIFMLDVLRCQFQPQGADPIFCPES